MRKIESSDLEPKRSRFTFFGAPEELLLAVGAAAVIIYALMAIFPFFLAPYNPIEIDALAVLKPPTWIHIMGTDYLGRDIASRVVYGTRTAISVAVLSVSLSLAIGTFLGLISGHFRGKTDRAITFAMDTLYAFPGLVLAILVVVMLGPGLMNMAISLSFWYIPTYYRMVRGEVLSVEGKSFVEAARAIGARDITIILDYILPNVVSPVVTLTSLNVADVVLATATLGFLGLGVPPPTPDWGSDLSAGYAYMLSGNWWLMAFPGLMVILLTLGFNLLGEGLAEILTRELS
jgi:peptide/nickel transport system permease protein